MRMSIAYLMLAFDIQLFPLSSGFFSFDICPYGVRAQAMFDDGRLVAAEVASE